MAIFLWNPLVCILIELGSGNFRVWGPSLIISLTVATVTATVCIFGAEFLLYLTREVRRFFKLRTIKFSKKVDVILTLALLTPGLLLGNEVAKVMLLQLTGQLSGFTHFSGYFYAGLVLFIVFTYVRFVDFKKEKRDLSFQLQKLEIENLKAKVSSLSSQMNPHFLFNSLNSIAAIIPDDPSAAELMTIKLADVYRGILRASQNDEHSLRDEVNICQDYLEIEKIRFGERLQTKISIESGLNIRTINAPVLIIQTLIENALKHGLSPKIEGGLIRLKVYSEKQHVFVEVEDDGVGINAPASDGHQVSMENCKERLKLLYKGAEIFKAKIDNKGSLVTFGIPVGRDV